MVFNYYHSAIVDIFYINISYYNNVINKRINTIPRTYTVAKLREKVGSIKRYSAISYKINFKKELKKIYCDVVYIKYNHIMCIRFNPLEK